MITVGDKAPNFTLRDTEKNQVSLSDFEGKTVLLLFFPLAFTGVCTKELCQIRDEKSLYEDLDATILAISVDSLFTLEVFKKQQGFEFTLLSDFNKEVCRSYGALYEDFVLEMKGVTKRSAFVIDSKGIVRYAEVLDNAGELPQFDKINGILAELN